jgi:hypothetical protein
MADTKPKEKKPEAKKKPPKVYYVKGHNGMTEAEYNAWKEREAAAAVERKKRAERKAKGK